MSYRKMIWVLALVAVLAGCGLWRSGVQGESAKKATAAAPAGASAVNSIDIKNTESLVVVFVVPPEKVKGLIPEPLMVSPYNVMYVAVSRTPLDAGFSHSLELGIGVTFKGRVYNYPVFRMVDNQKMSQVGRLITGSPTRIGDITFEKNGSSLKAVAARNGKVLFQASMKLGEEGEPLDNAPVVNLKVIPGEDTDALPTVKQLIVGKIEKMKVQELIDGECQFEFTPSPADGFPDVPVQQTFRSFYRKADFTLTSAGILYDYLKTN